MEAAVVSNEFSESEVPETADAKPEETSKEPSSLSDTGRLSIQGVPPDDDVVIESDQQPEKPENPEPDVSDSQEEEWITVYPGKHPEKLPNVEGEPRSVRLEEGSESQESLEAAKEDVEGKPGLGEDLASPEGQEPTAEGTEGGHDGKEGLEPPEGWKPGGPEFGF